MTPELEEYIYRKLFAISNHYDYMREPYVVRKRMMSVFFGFKKREFEILGALMEEADKPVPKGKDAPSVFFPWMARYLRFLVQVEMI